jgi:hypothetical protein
MEKQNLSKLKKQDLLNKKAGQKMSGEIFLSDELKGDKAFTDQHAEHGDENYGGKMKVKNNNPKFAANSLTEPKNGKLDGEKNLSNIKGGDTNFTDKQATNKDNKVKNDHISKNGSGTVGKGKTSADSELSRIAESGPTFNNLMNFGQYVLEACEEVEEYEEDKDELKEEEENKEENESFGDDFDFDTLSIEEKKKLPAALQAYIDKKKGKKGTKDTKGKKGAKPDFLDVDKDGDKKESIKKAANDKKKK